MLRLLWGCEIPNAITGSVLRSFDLEEVMRFINARRLRFYLLLPAIALAAFLASACADAESRDAPETMPGDEDPAAVESEPAAEPTAEADQPYDAPATEPAERTVPAGTTMTFRVDETIAATTHEPGDEFTATLTSSLTGEDGTEVIAAGAPSRWVVEEATTAEASAQQDQSLLAVRLESVQVNGDWMPVTATVTQADVQSQPGDTGTETAAKIGVGAAAGALIGQILGEDTESTLAGAGVGAAVGAVVALTTRGGDVALPEGSMIDVRLEEALTVS